LIAMASLLLVEDEALIRMMVADMLVELGHTVAAEAGDLASGLSLANSVEVDFAILDLQLGKDSSEPIAGALRRRNIPFAVASGYGKDGLPEQFRGCLHLAKPFQVEELQRTIAALLTGKVSGAS